MTISRCANPGAAVCRPGGKKVPQFECESGGLKPKTGEPQERIAVIGLGEDEAPGSFEMESEQVLQFSGPLAAELAGLDRRTIHKAVAEGRLRATLVKAEVGHRKGRPEFRISAADLFAFSPLAQRCWEAREAARELGEQLAREEAETAERQARIQAENPSTTDYAAACAWHLQACASYIESQGCGRKLGRVYYARALNEGEIEVPDWVRATKAAVSDRSLERWEKKLREGGGAALDPKWRSGFLPHLDRNPEQRNYVLGLLAQRPHLAARKIWEGLKARFGAEAAPAVDAVTRYLKKWKEENPEEYLRMLNPDKAKNKFQVAFGSRSEHVVRLNQLWETDATAADIIFKGDGTRYTLCAAVDVYSDRRRMLLTATPKGLAHGLLFRACLQEWGLPEVIKTDNGRDYTSAYMTRFFADLGIEQILCRPFSGEEKPHVERGFRTFLHDLVELLPGYIGHNVAQAQDLRAQKSFADRLKDAKKGDVVEAGMTREEFQVFMDQWILADDHRVRTSGRLKGKSPAQMVNAWAAENPIRRVMDMQGLDYLLLPATIKTIQKKGIRHQNRYFIAPELGDIVGLQVEIRESPEDAGRIQVYKDGAFLCLAEDPNMTGTSRAEVAARARERQKAASRAQKEVQRELKKLADPKEVVQEILQDRLAAVDPVATFQTPIPVSSTSMAAVAAARAAENLAKQASRAEKPAPRLDPEEEAAIRAAIAPKQPLEDPKARFIRLLRAPFVPVDDREWMDFFATTPEGEGILLGFHNYKQA